MNKDSTSEYTTLGAGCFWCIDTIFRQTKGVISVKSGFSGGFIKNPAYREVVMGRTGHAEVAHIEFDPEEISFAEILEIFWQVHDPTTLNRQGADVGTQYRSAIFYHNELQKKIAEEMKERLNESDIFQDPVVTEISEFDAFYEAEDYHQDFYKHNEEMPYCTFVIKPKVQKFKRLFADKMK